MADDNWMVLRLRFGEGELAIRVSPWAADQLAAGLSVATLWSDHPDEIAVTEDGRIVEQHESENQWQGTAGLPFGDADDFAPKGPLPPLPPLVGFDPTGTEAWLVDEDDDDELDDEP